MKACAPGKIILSGEHAVVYGRPAIACAISRHVFTEVCPGTSGEVWFDLPDLAYAESLSLCTLRRLKKRLMRQYELFLEGMCSICDVLVRPMELLLFACIHLYERLGIGGGLRVRTSSSLPLGAGLGSSAASALSLLCAVQGFCRGEAIPESLRRDGYAVERLQHGRPSGLDLEVCLQGGGWYFREGHLKPCDIPEQNLYWVHTGMPLSRTGECVPEVRKRFPESSPIWDDFEALTEAVLRACNAGQHGELPRLFNENHRLLGKIGVVPSETEEFIEKLRSSGLAAKVSGAGAVRGSSAGGLLVFADDESRLSLLCKERRYPFSKLEVDRYGTRLFSS